MSSADGLTTPVLSTIGSPHLGRPRAGAFYLLRPNMQSGAPLLCGKGACLNGKALPLNRTPKEKAPTGRGRGSLRMRATLSQLRDSTLGALRC
jgi:hypothetical protein